MDLVRRLARACETADLDALEAVLAPGVVAVCDGGGLVPAGPVPVHGAAAVARLVLAVLGGHPRAGLTVESVNGRPGLALRRDGLAVAVVAVGSHADRITAVWIVLNPEKLRSWHRR